MTDSNDRIEPLDLAAIESRAMIASPGPWSPVRGNNDGAVRALLWDVQVNIAECMGHEANAEFIAHARTDVPALVARVRDLEAKNLRLVSLVSQSARVHGDDGNQAMEKMLHEQLKELHEVRT